MSELIKIRISTRQSRAGHPQQLVATVVSGFNRGARTAIALDPVSPRLPQEERVAQILTETLGADKWEVVP